MSIDINVVLASQSLYIVRSSTVIFSALRGTVKNLSCLGLLVLGRHLPFIKVAMFSRVRSSTESRS